MTDKPETRITKTLAAMATGRPLHKIQQMCERQKSVTCSVLAQMVEEAQDINTDYALAFKYGHEAARAADKARIGVLERELAETQGISRDEELRANGYSVQLSEAKARIAELEKERDEWHRLFDSAGQLSKNACDDLNSAKSRIAELEAEKARCFIPEGVWHEGCPRHPYGSEWFIAKLDNGQRVVLKELPEEHSYDYRTADETYYSAYRIAAWMQFPDSQYVAALAQHGKESANGQ
tara:strand:+ start:805 stop:1515 length:711 start_codon:yes stop_codon:yes gene_type:complete